MVRGLLGFAGQQGEAKWQQVSHWIEHKLIVALLFAALIGTHRLIQRRAPSQHSFFHVCFCFTVVMSIINTMTRHVSLLESRVRRPHYARRCDCGFDFTWPLSSLARPVEHHQHCRAIAHPGVGKLQRPQKPELQRPSETYVDDRCKVCAWICGNRTA